MPAMSMRDPAEAFSTTYAEARTKFLAAAGARGYAVESHVHPSALGAEGEPLAMDVATGGRGDADALLLITSGTHGVEGFCGSGCQVALLGDDAFAVGKLKEKCRVTKPGDGEHWVIGN